MMPDQTSLDLEHWSSLSESKRKCLREMNENALGSPINMTVLYNHFRYCQMNYSDFLDAIDTAVLELGFFANLSEKALFKQVRDIRVFIEFEIFSLFEVSGNRKIKFYIQVVMRKLYIQHCMFFYSRGEVCCTKDNPFFVLALGFIQYSVN